VKVFVKRFIVDLLYGLLGMAYCVLLADAVTVHFVLAAASKDSRRAGGHTLTSTITHDGQKSQREEGEIWAILAEASTIYICKH